ncbi:MAG: alpha/beta hydrolase [Kiritimatiellales bacterium]
MSAFLQYRKNFRRHLIPAAVLCAALFHAPPVLCSEFIIYAQSFANNVDKVGQFCADYGWKTYSGSAAGDFSSNSKRITYFSGAAVMANVRALSPYGQEIDRGCYLVKSKHITLAYVPLPEGVYSNLNLKFSIRHDALETQTYFAFQAGDTWYVSQDTFSNTNAFKECSIALAGDVQFRRLNFTPRSVLEISSDAPVAFSEITGDIINAGFLLEPDGTVDTNMRVDNFVITGGGRVSSSGTIFAVKSFLPADAGFTGFDEAVVYKTAGSEQLHFYLYKPAGWQSSDRRPMILFFHGGGWIGGSPSQYASACRTFADKGFVTATVKYRLAAAANRPPGMDTVTAHFRTVEDAKSAFRYTKANAAAFGVDPAKIITAGSSAGAHLSICVALLDVLNDPADNLDIVPDPAAVILMCPVIDTGPPPGYEIIYNRFKNRYKEFSPIDNLRSNMPPQLILLGDKDTILSEEHAQTYQSKVRALGSVCELVMVAGAGHSAFYTGKYAEAAIQETTDFLETFNLTGEYHE